MATDTARIAELAAQLRFTRVCLLCLLLIVLALGMHVLFGPFARQGQSVLIDQAGGRALLTVDGDTTMLRLEAGQASVQLAARADGTAVLLLNDSGHQQQAILDVEGLRLKQGERVVGQVP